MGTGYSVAPEYVEHARANLTRRLDRKRQTAEDVLQAWDWVQHFLGRSAARPQAEKMKEEARLAVLEAVLQTTGKTSLGNFNWLMTPKEQTVGSVTFGRARDSRKVTLTV